MPQIAEPLAPATASLDAWARVATAGIAAAQRQPLWGSASRRVRWRPRGGAAASAALVSSGKDTTASPWGYPGTTPRVSNAKASSPCAARHMRALQGRRPPALPPASIRRKNFRKIASLGANVGGNRQCCWGGVHGQAEAACTGRGAAGPVGHVTVRSRSAVPMRGALPDRRAHPQQAVHITALLLLLYCGTTPAAAHL